jgi:hypothetical protein
MNRISSQAEQENRYQNRVWQKDVSNQKIVQRQSSLTGLFLLSHLRIDRVILKIFVL